MQFRKIILLLLTAFLVFVAVMASFVIKTDYSPVIPPERPCTPKPDFRLETLLTGKNSANLQEQFPFEAYLDAADWCNVNAISRDLQTLDSINADSAIVNRGILAKALTSELEKRLTGTFINYYPDSMILMLQWAERFHNYQDVDKKNSKLYRIVYRHWFNYMSNKLGEYSNKQPDIKYGFKFKYLVAVCQAKTFSPPVGNSKGEKVVNYFIEQNYSYLFNRFWNGTGMLFKTAMAAGLVILLYAAWCVFKVNFGKKH